MLVVAGVSRKNLAPCNSIDVDFQTAVVPKEIKVAYTIGDDLNKMCLTIVCIFKIFYCSQCENFTASAQGQKFHHV